MMYVGETCSTVFFPTRSLPHTHTHVLIHSLTRSHTFAHNSVYTPFTDLYARSSASELQSWLVHFCSSPSPLLSSFSSISIGTSEFKRISVCTHFAHRKIISVAVLVVFKRHCHNENYFIVVRCTLHSNSIWSH